MTTFDADVLVVGSGFGGSVAALRAAEAGKKVIVCEQGRRLSDDDLRRGARSVRHLLWEPALGRHGYLRQTVFRHVAVVSGVAVGGGSIVYAAVLLRPGADAFADEAWARTGVDWAAELDPHFDVAGGMLGRQVNPDRGLQDLWLRGAARRMGAGDTFGATPQGIDFDACIRCGDCLAGCPHGAKNSLDRTYLAQAERLGAVIRPLSQVEVLLPMATGWRVGIRNPLDHRSVSHLTVRSLVLAGGVLGTTRLLLANRDRWQTLPGVASALGHHVRTNSEAFAAVLHPPGIDVTTGAAISSDFYPDAMTHVTNNRFPPSFSFMKWYLSLPVTGDDQAARRRQALASLVRHPMAATANARIRGWHHRVTVLTVMQQADNEMSLQMRGRRLRSVLAEGTPRPPSFLPQADAAGRALAAASGGRAFGTALDSLLGVGATAHILGGAVIADGPHAGVVDADHRVFGYDNLRVMDGSVIPANIGVNPSWTITAMAERAMGRWLG